MDRHQPLLSIIIPVYNEGGYVSDVLDAVMAAPYETQIIVVDDGSTDDTGEHLSGLNHPDVTILRHEHNTGKGAAVRTGLIHARGEVILIQDADMEYHPDDYSLLLEPVFNGRADVVFGSRFAGFGAHRVLYFWHYAGNRFLTLLSNIFTDLNLTDMETGYKVFTRKALEGIAIKENRFGFEPEITAKLACKKDLRIYEVPISYFGRTYRDGKKITWRDGVWALWCIIKYNLFK
ncbi:MAG: glycosyltransferase family 2 protein [Thermodesulfobacteriota bacterium]|nr:glycosyltransferase family 2 protein [Thermodesulfobacteriota bacterium]